MATDKRVSTQHGAAVPASFYVHDGQSMASQRVTVLLLVYELRRTWGGSMSDKLRVARIFAHCSTGGPAAAGAIVMPPQLYCGWLREYMVHDCAKSSLAFRKPAVAAATAAARPGLGWPQGVGLDGPA